MSTQELRPGQWFYANHESNKDKTLCRLDRRKRAKNEYKIEIASIIQPWDPFNRDHQTKMQSEKADLYWIGTGGKFWTTYYPRGWRDACHPGMKFPTEINKIDFLSDKDAKQWESARKSSKRFYQTAHQFGCFRDQRSSAQKFIQDQTLPKPGRMSGQTEEETFNV